MAKDDYHVIVYWLLSYLYFCLRKGKQPDTETLCLMDYPQDLNDDYKLYILKHLYDAGFIEGVVVQEIPVLGTNGKIAIRSLDKTRITPAGIDYLQNNSTMKKVKEFIKHAAGPLITLFATIA